MEARSDEHAVDRCVQGVWLRSAFQPMDGGWLAANASAFEMTSDDLYLVDRWWVAVEISAVVLHSCEA